MAGGRFYLPPISGYDQFEVVSALRKTIKLGDVEQAIYWLNVLLENGLAKKAARNLWIMAAEDIDEPMVVLRAFAVFQMVNKVGETDHLFFLVSAMCSAPDRDLAEPKSVAAQLVELAHAMTAARKWWETHEGREVDRLWSKAIGDLKDPGRRRPIPDVALDQHTRRGKQLARQGAWGKPGQLRDELSGTDAGRQKTVYQFLANGHLDPAYRLFDDDPGFRELYRQQQVLQGSRRPSPAPKPDEPPPPCLFDETDPSDVEA